MVTSQFFYNSQEQKEITDHWGKGKAAPVLN